LDEKQAGATPHPDASRLALDRTRLAHDRTLLAWVRTSTSLISFGFTIYKFFQYLHQSSRGAPPEQSLGPREFAMLMITIGLLALVLATVQHRRDMEALRAQYGKAEVPYSGATLLAGLVGALGVLGLIAAFAHV
jgi:putative membrane protein